MENYKVEDLMNNVGTEFFINKQYSGTEKAKLVMVQCIPGGWQCVVEEVKHEYNDIQPQSGKVEIAPAWLVYNAIMGR